MTVEAPAALAVMSDAEIVQRVRQGHEQLFELLMRRHNRKVYRVIRSVLNSENEIEDVMQQAYLQAFAHLHQFEGRSSFSTWLIRIALHESFARRRRLARAAFSGDGGQEPQNVIDTLKADGPSPEQHAYAQQLRRVLETAVDELPDAYRQVFMMRDVEGLTTSETGAALGIGEEAVKTRLHRARAMLRRDVSSQLGTVAPGAFDFHAPRCDMVVASVMRHITASGMAGAPARSAGGSDCPREPDRS